MAPPAMVGPSVAVAWKTGVAPKVETAVERPKVVVATAAVGAARIPVAHALGARVATSAEVMGS